MSVNDAFRSLNVGLPEDILRRKLYGDFEGAIRLIDRRLARPNLPQGLRDCMTAQREMMLRTPPDYPYTRDQALARVREQEAAMIDNGRYRYPDLVFEKKRSSR